MPYVGRLIVSRARKQQKCRSCKGMIEVRDWYFGLVGVNKKTGKAWTRRYHEQCFFILIGQVKAGLVDAVSGRKTGRKAPVDDAHRLERKRLVALRYYHTRQGNLERVDDINDQLLALGAGKREPRELTVDEQLEQMGWRWEKGYRPNKEEKLKTLARLKDLRAESLARALREAGDGSQKTS